MSHGKRSLGTSPVAPPRLLGLPVRARREALVGLAAVGAFYLATMSRDLGFYDSAELALVAAQGGLGHPLGQPAHTLLGWLFARLPGVPALVGLNLLSALPTVLCLVPLVSIAERLGGAGSPRAGAARVTLIALWLLHPLAWENGSRVEVYGLGAFFALWGLARLAAALDVARAGGHRPGRSGALAGLACGLAASVHAVIAAAVVFPALPAALWGAWRSPARRRLAVGVVVGGLAGLLPYLYVVAVAGRQDVLVWGAPVDAESLRAYFSVADYRHNQGQTLAGLAEHLSALATWSAGNGLLIPVALGTLGWVWAGGAGLGRAAAPVAAALSAVVIAGNVIFHVEVPDYLGYLTPAGGLLVAGAVALVFRLSARGEAGRLTAGAVAGALALGALWGEPAPWARSRAEDRVARSLATGALEAVPANGLLVVESDHWAFPLLYLQEVEAHRPDVVLLLVGLADSSWYWAHLYRRHPDLSPFALRGPGGRAERVRRFRDAHAGRLAHFESFGYAVQFGAPACPGRWLIGDAALCADGLPADDAGAERASGGLTAALEAAHGVTAGEATTAQVVARLGYERGEALWRLGLPTAALAVLRAGIHPALRPEGSWAAPAAPPLRGPPPSWQEAALIGNPAHNLYLAARLLHAAGDVEGARAHLVAAGALGLAEAVEWVR